MSEKVKRTFQESFMKMPFIDISRNKNFTIDNELSITIATPVTFLLVHDFKQNNKTTPLYYD